MKKIKQKCKDYPTVQRVRDNFLSLTLVLLPSFVFNAEVRQKISLLQNISIFNKLEN